MKILLFYFFFLLIYIGTLSPASAQTKSAADWYHQGISLETRDTAASFDHFIKAVETARNTNPDLYFAALWKADSLGYFALGGRWADAGLKLLRANLSSLAHYHGNDRVAAELYYLGAEWLTSRVVMPDSSIYCFEQAKNLFMKTFGPRSAKVADCYHGLGDVYKYYLFDFDGAEENYETALDIREHLTQVDPMSMARNYYNLATVNRSQHDYQKALSYGFRAMDAVSHLNRPDFLDATYSMIGNIYRDMNEYDSAKKLYRKAIASNLKNHGGKPNENLAFFYAGLGEILLKESRWEESIANYDQALAMYAKVPFKDHLLFVNALLQASNANMQINDDAAALKRLDQARKEIDILKLSKSGTAAALYEELGRLKAKQGKTDSALFYFQKSLSASAKDFNSMGWKDNPALSAIDLGIFAYRTLLTKADVLMGMVKKSRNPEMAQSVLACYILAEKILSNARSQLDTEDAKWAYLDSNFELYEKGIAACFEFYQMTRVDSLLETAYHYMEGSKSRSLSDALHFAETSHGLADSLIIQRNKLKATFFRIQDKLAQSDQHAKENLRGSLVELDKKIRDIEGRIEKKYPSYLKTQQEFTLAPIVEVQDFSRREKGMVLEYFWGNQNVYAMGIAADGVRFDKIGASDSLAFIIRDIVAAFDPDESVMDPLAYKSFTETSWKLYQKLVGPFEDLDKDGLQRITVVPDGLIDQVPFEVLIRKPALEQRINYRTLSYLLVDRVIDYAFSISIMMHRPGAAISDPKLLAFGLTGTGFRYGPVQDDNGAAGKELEALARYFPSGKFFLGNQATKDGFTQLAPQFDLIHLAVHGKGDPDKNYAASLYFKKDSLSDGELHWYELYGLHLKATLAVLSSCESGIGKAYRGEGMLSMANAFAYAGCKNIVLGLWKVNDKVSVALMSKFYEGLLNGDRIDDALCNAKRSYLLTADELTAHPKLWGALVAYGSQPVATKNKGEWIVILALGLMGMAAFAAFRGRRRL